MGRQVEAGRIDPWGRELAGPGKEELYLTAEETESGVDLTQLRWNLSLTPLERLIKAVDLYEASERLRGRAQSPTK